MILLKIFLIAETIIDSKIYKIKKGRKKGKSPSIRREVSALTLTGRGGGKQGGRQAGRQRGNSVREGRRIVERGGRGGAERGGLEG